MNEEHEWAALYRRVSTNRQDTSLEAQESRVLEYTNYRRLHTDELLSFSDPEASGSTPLVKRAGGAALMERLQAGDVKHLIVAKLDRLGRGTKDFLETFETLDRLGVVLHIADFGGDSISTKGHIGKLILTILAAVYEAELGEIRERTRKILAHKFSKGELIGTVPFGFQVKYTFANNYSIIEPRALNSSQLADFVKEHGEVRGKTLLPHLAEQEWVRAMVRWRWPNYPDQRTKGFSYEAIAKRLNAAGVRSKTGGAWQCGNVESVLKSKHTAKIMDLDRQ